MKKYSRLLAPFNIGALTLSNRIVMPPVVTYLAGDDGLVTPAHIEHYRRLEGPGLVIVEGTAVLPEGRINKRQLGIYEDRHIKGLSRLAKIIHAGGGAAGIQIHHAGALAFLETRQRKFKRYFGALSRLARQQFSVIGLRRIRESFRAASRRAVAAGFDIIEIHGAHGYLFSQFLSPVRNWRFDRYGGPLENRSRLLLEVFQEVCSEVNGKALATCRLGIADGHRRGLSLGDGLAAARALEREGAKLLDISRGSGMPAFVRPEASPYSCLLHLAKAAKRVLSIPVIGGGEVRSPDLAEQALRDNLADLIFVGRGMLADPGWARKVVEGRADTIVRCHDCGFCFHHADKTRCPARRKLSNS